MNILVMGGTEFVSSSLTKYLISKGYAVAIFTRGIRPVKYGGIKKHFKGDRKSIEALYSEQAVGQAYNATHPQSVTWEQLVETTSKVVNKKVNIKKIDSGKLKIGVREYFHFRNITYLLDTKKAEKMGCICRKLIY